MRSHAHRCRTQMGTRPVFSCVSEHIVHHFSSCCVVGHVLLAVAWHGRGRRYDRCAVHGPLGVLQRAHVSKGEGGDEIAGLAKVLDEGIEGAT